MNDFLILSETHPFSISLSHNSTHLRICPGKSLKFSDRWIKFRIFPKFRGRKSFVRHTAKYQRKSQYFLQEINKLYHGFFIPWKILFDCFQKVSHRNENFPKFFDFLLKFIAQNCLLKKRVTEDMTSLNIP